MCKYKEHYSLGPFKTEVPFIVTVRDKKKRIIYLYKNNDTTKLQKALENQTILNTMNIK